MLHPMKFLALLTLIFIIGLPSVAKSQTNTQRGAVAGGAAGAIIGGIVGKQNNETAEGALIGGALGALTGGLMGNDRDRQVQQQFYYQQQQAAAYRNGISLNDVTNLSGNGVSSEVIINQIQINGVQQRIGVNEIIALHQQGVNNRVIDAMQRAPLATDLRVTPSPPQYPVVVEPVVVPRVIWATPRPHYPPHHHRPYRRGSSFHFHYRF